MSHLLYYLYMKIKYCASRGGKLAQHANSVPKISFLKCKACGACARNCPEKAIVMGPKYNLCF
jgi:formate hydrogenlyase subunit 6/NADH:ubiquinone oxidoreductase subunit I